jgi:hypothetical protein
MASGAGAGAGVGAGAGAGCKTTGTGFGAGTAVVSGIDCPPVIPYGYGFANDALYAVFAAAVFAAVAAMFVGVGSNPTIVSPN